MLYFICTSSFIILMAVPFFYFAAVGSLICYGKRFKLSREEFDDFVSRFPHPFNIVFNSTLSAPGIYNRFSGWVGRIVFSPLPLGIVLAISNKDHTKT